MSILSRKPDLLFVVFIWLVGIDLSLSQVGFHYSLMFTLRDEWDWRLTILSCPPSNELFQPE